MPELTKPLVHIPLLVPDMPAAEELLPWLMRIDAARWYSNFGPLVQAFEATLAGCWLPGRLPVKVVTLGSGTAALELAIGALALSTGAQVLVPAFTFPATASAVLRHGGIPLFADVSPTTWQMTPELARRVAEQHRLALVMPVATFGCPVDVVGWDAFVEETGIPVLIDAAGAFGNQAVGVHSAVAFSFHATKPFGIGEGGALVTRNERLAERVRRLSNFGFKKGGLVLEAGTNAKLSEYGAAVGLAQWERWPSMQAMRRDKWASYRAHLAALPGVGLQAGFDGVALPAPAVLHLPCEADLAAKALARSGIETRRWYCPPLHQHPAFAGLPVVGPQGDAVLPETDRLANHALGVPWHSFLQEEDMVFIAHALRTALEGLF